MSSPVDRPVGPPPVETPVDGRDVVAGLLAENRRLVGELRRPANRPVAAAGARGADEIRADLDRVEAFGPGQLVPDETRRLLGDVPPLLAEVDRLREDNERLERHRAVWQANCEDNSAVCDLLQSVIDSLIAERDAARGVVQAVEAAIPNALMQIGTIRHGLTCSMRSAIYEGMRCDCDLIGHIRSAVESTLRAALAASFPVPTEDADEGNAHVTETYRQTINGREQLGWQCVTCLTHQLVCAGPGIGKPVPAADVALLDRLAAEHVLAAAVPTVPTEPTCEHRRTVAHQMPNTYALVICPGPVPTEDVTPAAKLGAVSALIEQARKVSPSPAMTVYVGDLEQALGLRVESVRGIVGAES